VDSAPASATQQSTGSPLPFLIGAAAVAVLGASGGLIAWRRRRTG
jgi:LPXTG-motif cell wall-anchored protein